MTTGRLLYRGESDETLRAPTIRSPKSDLLNAIYDSQPQATDFFRYISDALIQRSSALNMSRAHIASADVQVASEWGIPESVWPLDVELHYAWLKRDRNWWDAEWGTPQSRRGPVFWRSSEKLNTFLENEVRVDTGLEAALAKGGEVLFSNSFSPAGSGYLSVPLFLEPQLLALLGVQPFSQSMKVTEAPQMTTEGSIKKKFNIPISGR